MTTVIKFLKPTFILFVFLYLFFLFSPYLIPNCSNIYLKDRLVKIMNIRGYKDANKYLKPLEDGANPCLRAILEDYFFDCRAVRIDDRYIDDSELGALIKLVAFPCQSKSRENSGECLATDKTIKIRLFFSDKRFFDIKGNVDE